MMPSEKEIHKNITDACRSASDPKRAGTNLHRLMEASSGRERFLPYLKDVAKLFAASQFLSNYCISNPDELFAALKELKTPVTKKFLSVKGKTGLALAEELDLSDILKRLRLFKKSQLLRITLRDITGETDTLSSMDELTCLAEFVIDFALDCSLKINSRHFGGPSDDGLALIALGKLGGEELNYSSDVDLIAVYAGEEGQTSGTVSPSGVLMNRISSSEFYFKVMELFNKILSRNTEDGIVYRVDLRLRPQGEKGEVALPLSSYKTYYEAWGRTWERMALIRARPVAGNMRLGKAFMETIGPFVWKKTMDYSGIEEIKALKKKIDSSFSRDDIKRGYGGIREAEFFIQTFQLIYGPEHGGLRTHRFLNAIQSLRWLGMVPEEELVTLRENYLHLRRVEHLLQMKDDLQTHSLPSSEDDLKSLAIKSGFTSTDRFLSDLRMRRMKIRNMYNSLLGTEEDVHAEALSLLEGDLSDDELSEYLSFRGIKNPPAGLMNLKGMREQFEFFKTQRERTVMRKVIPLLIEKALNSESPDRALKGLVSFFTVMGIKETYLTGFTERKELQDGIIKIFSLSTNLTRIFLSNTRYLDLLLEGNIIRKTLSKTREELKKSIPGENFETGIAEYKNVEEIRLGSFFLMHVMKVNHLVRCLSHLAEAVIGIIVENCQKTENRRQKSEGRSQKAGFAVLGMGKLGSREMTFGSDLDIIFLSESPDELKTAEKILKTLTAYTDKGIIYNVDMRLRPDGIKGALINNLEGYRNYYLKNAHPWEIQALLKVRPIAGDMDIARSFAEMAKEVILKRGVELKREDIKSMRERIMKELSHEPQGVDVKLGPGGIEEIEFFVQWLQLNNATGSPEILVQDTASAIRRLAKKGILRPENGRALLDAYEYLRTLETLMRLNEEHVIVKDSDFTELAGIFMGHKNKEEFVKYLKGLRSNVLEVVGAG
ncbi:MAG: bifunctional [glutamate--ammonia ligase]-adenylyl-L-tyrosine phosphorylase/[glutamate--ammonia-ligase] adenylyltransferase [Nitrospirae bacterium]|nr:bifunctional [glutamate--ammonia ligase]-adenylyl-L-tyrosine phosphorylase/[glutamate--ammonia-ligase] adenylyltransferase [Nitrospirota bacterium]